MGKKGPCYHCGVTSTPLWRNGPPEKPVLCNACGSRWRTKGTLENYTPIHARTEIDDFEDYNVTRKKTISLKKEEVKQFKRKQHHENVLVLRAASDDIQGFRRPLNEDMSNRSSSGSAVSNSESCAQFGSTDASDLTGPSQSIVWDTTVPSRKRTCVNRPKQSPVEKLTKDLYTILHEQSSYISKSSEEDLIFESNTPMVSVEIGHGSVLIRHPSSIAREEESEASSLSVENKPCPINEMYSCSKLLPVCNDKRGMRFASSGVEIIKNSSGLGLQQDQIKREKFQHENCQYLGNHSSPLQHVDLTDVVNFEEFVRHLSNEEQQLLLKYLPPVDAGKPSDSLKNMFDSFQFKENLSSFQQLLAEGVFDTSSWMKTSDCKNLKRLALGNLTKSKWVEQYNFLKHCRNNSAQTLVDEGKIADVPRNVMTQNDYRNQNFSEGKARMRSPKRVLTKASCESKEAIDHDSSCFSPRSLFSMPPDGSPLMLDSSSDQDLLLDVPFNGSFPQAELLNPASSSFRAQASATSSTALAYPWQCS